VEQAIQVSLLDSRAQLFDRMNCFRRRERLALNRMKRAGGLIDPLLRL
jgi:hypothetical protein